MAQCAFLVLPLVYVPSIIVVKTDFFGIGGIRDGHLTTAYYICMYLPHFVLIAVFGHRMWGHLHTLGHEVKEARREEMIAAGLLDEVDSFFGPSNSFISESSAEVRRELRLRLDEKAEEEKRARPQPWKAVQEAYASGGQL